MDGGRQFKLWPVHPAPQDDELLSSWMVRLAHGNGFKVQAFYSEELGRNAALWNRDIDRCARENLIERLADRTGRIPDDIKRLTLHSLEGFLAEDLQSPQTPWVLSLGAYHRTRKRPSLMFCPYCLRDDAEPYLRKAWRLACMTCCTMHGNALLDSCPSCGAYVQVHRIDMIHRSALARGVSLATCYRCRADLRQSQAPPATASLLALQRFLEAALARGYVDFAGNPSLHSLSFFSGLHRLVRGLLTAKVRGARDLRLLPTIPKNRPPEELSVDARLRVMDFAATALEAWPNEFIRLCDGLRQPFHAFHPEKKTPYWFANPVDRRLRRAPLAISQEEADFMAEATAAVAGHFRPRHVRTLFKRYVEWHLTYRRPPPTLDDVNEFVDAIDHAIAGASGEHRLDYLRDKAMFVTARVLGLRQQSLAALVIDDIPQVRNERSMVRRASELPSNPTQLYSWLNWYLKEVRPLYPKADQAREVFLCRGRRGRMSDSLVGARFTHLLQASHMHRRIRDYAHWIQPS